MGLVELEQIEEQRCFCLFRDSIRVAYAQKPSLEFVFTQCDEDDEAPYSPQEFEREFRLRLREVVPAAMAKGLAKLTMTQFRQGLDLTVAITGDGHTLEEIRGRVDSGIPVLSYE